MWADRVLNLGPLAFESDALESRVLLMYVILIDLFNETVSFNH